MPEKPGAPRFGIWRVASPLLLLLPALLLPRTAAAQQLDALVLRWDNDILALRGAGPPPDYDYTQGIRLSAEFRSFPRGLGQAGTGAPPMVARLGVGQRIYTPRRDGSEPVPGERPYAGWLYAAVGLSVVRLGVEHHLDAELGMTGPAALGEQVQNGFHRLVGSTLQQGWAHQLGWEPGIGVRYGAGWPRSLGAVRIRPQVEAGLGTVWTGAAGGLSLSLGTGQARGLYVGGEVRQEWVAHNLFLDGNTFRQSVQAEKRTWVSEGALGLGHRFARWEVGYRFVARSPEYHAQMAPHGYGSITLTWRPAYVPGQ